MASMSSPATCWAAISPPNRRGERWINYTCMSHTKREVRAMMVRDYREGSDYSKWGYWRKKGWTIERVTIQIAEEKTSA